MKVSTVAYHEAGHAFADWHFHFKVKRVTIVPKKGDYAGLVESKTGLHTRSLEYTNPSGARTGRLHDRVVAVLAGNAAQRRYSPGSVRAGQAKSDREHAFILLSRLHSEAVLPYAWRYLEARARDIVENPMHWRVITHLAESLLKHRTMTGAQVEAAIREGYALDFQERKAAKAKGGRA